MSPESAMSPAASSTPSRAPSSGSSPGSSPALAGDLRRTHTGRLVLAQAAVLALLTLVLFREQFGILWDVAIEDPEMAVLRTLPVLLLLWVWARRHDLVRTAADGVLGPAASSGSGAGQAAAAADGSADGSAAGGDAAARPPRASTVARGAGVALWILGAVVFIGTHWPLAFFQPRLYASGLMLAGVFLFCGGFRLLVACLPVIALVWLAIPLGDRIAEAIFGPVGRFLMETNVTIVNQVVPDVIARLDTDDLLYVRAGVDGAVFVGTPYRSMGTFFMLLALGTVVVFARPRPAWQWVTACLVLPIVVLVGLQLRLTTWTAAAILTHADLVADGPRMLGTVAGFAWTWGAMSVFLWVLGMLVRGPEEAGGAAAAGASPGDDAGSSASDEASDPTRLASVVATTNLTTTGGAAPPPMPRFAARGFVTTSVLVALFAVAIPIGVQRLLVVTAKSAIDIRQSFDAFDADALPSFRLRPDRTLDTQGPEWVGTEEMRIMFVEPTADDVPTITDPNGLPILFLTYYSDPEDTIPHTPEVCYTQAGAIIGPVSMVPLELDGRDDGPHLARTIVPRQGDTRRVVMYVLYHNGVVRSSRNGVRIAMSMPGTDFTYFAKIEAVIPVTDAIDRAEAIQIGTRLLEEAIPRVAAEHLPFDEALQSAE